MVKDKTLYTRLGLEPEASETDIRKAYNQLSKKWHPDKNPDNKEEAETKFKEITEAKEILMDTEKRELYNKVGMDILKNNMQGDPQENMFPGFGNMFGGGFPFGMGNMQQRPNQPEHIVKDLSVTLEQIYKEETINIKYDYKVTCNNCNGEGVKNGKKSTCNNCKGNGVSVYIKQVGPGMIQQSVGPCHHCAGKGRIINDVDKCDECKGETFNIRTKEIAVPLKCGLLSGHKIHMREQGHQLSNVKTDLILTIQQTPHKIFTRNNNDLFITIELKLYQALFGFEKMITHLDGRKLRISYVGNTDFNTIRKLSNEGMKELNAGSENNKGTQRGHLYVKFKINLPTMQTLPNNTKEVLKSVLKQFNNDEVLSETNIINGNNVKQPLVELKHSEIDNINNLLYELSKESKENRSNRNQQETQCSQQ
jgi:DnaJ-class molecular chaperone